MHHPIPITSSSSLLVKELINSCSEAGYDFCPSDPSLSNPYSLFFYHVPKTGGLRFILPIAASIQALASNIHEPIIGKLFAHPTLAPTPLQSHACGLQSLEVYHQTSDYVFYCDHNLNYPSHIRDQQNTFLPDVRAITVLRDPKKRLKSGISYLYRLRNYVYADTEKLVDQGHLHLDNPITRSFSGKRALEEQLEPSDVERACEALCSLNDVYDISNYSRVRAAQHDFISKHRLPNIIVPKLINPSNVPITDRHVDLLYNRAISNGYNCFDEQVYREYISRLDSGPGIVSINMLHPLTFIFTSSLTDHTGTTILPPAVVPTLDLLLSKVSISNVI